MSALGGWWLRRSAPPAIIASLAGLAPAIASAEPAWAHATAAPARSRSATVQSSQPRDSAAAVFERHRIALLRPGLHAQDGWWFSTVSQVLPDGAAAYLVDSTRRRLATQALGQLSQVRYRNLVPDSSAAPEVRRVAAEVARGCDPGPWSASGIVTVVDESDAGTVVVVRAVPAESMLAARLTVDQVLSCIRNRKRALTPDEAMTLLELGPGEGPDHDAAIRALLSSLDAAFGRGISMTVRREWTAADGRACGECVEGWSLPASAAAAAADESRDRYREAHAGELAKLDRDEALQLLGRRMHDHALRSHIASLLKSSGWHRCAEEIGGATLPAVPPSLSKGSSLPTATRRALLESPLIVTLIMSGGSAPIALSPIEGPEISDTLKCLERDPTDSHCGAARTLIASLERAPSSPAAKVLAGLLLGSGEPAVARVLAQAVLRERPDDALAGLYFLRASMALGDRESADRASHRMLSEVPLIPRWRQEVEAIREWSRGEGK